MVLPEVFYGELQGLARQLAFTVSGLAALDQIERVKDSLTVALQTGEGFQSWKQRLLAAEDLGLPDARIETIFRTNVQGCYNRGRWERIQAVKDSLPYWLYDAINDSRVRKSHLALDGIIRPADDPFWNIHAPPGGLTAAVD